MKKTCGTHAIAPIERTDFGVEPYVQALADEVTMEIRAEATKNG